MADRAASVVAKVALGQLVAEETLFTLSAEARQQALRDALVPGTSVTRYGRTWRMGQHREEFPWIIGRIGFEAAGGVTELWDDATQDFVLTPQLRGHTAPFAIELTDLRIGFQLRGQVIKPMTFRSNFRALLDQAAGTDWEVSLEGESEEWESWVAKVDRLTQLHVRLERPNPHYHGHDTVEELVQTTGARLVDVTFRAKKEQLNKAAAVIVEMLGFAEEYGRADAKGIDPAGDELKWRQASDESIREVDVEADPKTGEALPDALKEAVAKAPVAGGHPRAARRRRPPH